MGKVTRRNSVVKVIHRTENVETKVNIDVAQIVMWIVIGLLWLLA